MSSPTTLASTPAAARPLPWKAIAWFTILLLVLFAQVFAGLIREWGSDEDMGHGFFVIPVALYVTWQKRDELLAIKPQPSPWGYLFILGGFLFLLAGVLGAEFFISRVGLLVSLVGMLLALAGWPLLKALAFPLILLPFMVRIPAIIYGQITLPLQLLASSLAEHALNLIGIPVLREGNILELASRRLSVVEACSGIRSLLSLTFLSLVYGHFFEPRLWIRVVLLIATVPIAILANAFRVTVTGLLYEYKSEWADGFYHTMEGWVIFMVALAAVAATHRTLGWIALRRDAA